MRGKIDLGSRSPFTAEWIWLSIHETALIDLCDRWHAHYDSIHYAPPKKRNLCVEMFSVFSDLQKYFMFSAFLGPGGGCTFPTISLVNHSTQVLACCWVGLKPCLRNSLSHPQLNLLIGATQEQQQCRLGTAAATTYHRAIFGNPPPRVIYLNMDTAR